MDNHCSSLVGLVDESLQNALLDRRLHVDRHVLDLQMAVGNQQVSSIKKIVLQKEDFLHIL
jgi:hypothetical protein